MSGELQTLEQPLSVAALRTNIQIIAEAMRLVMKKDVHYGIVPGCKKPSLYKPGAEKIAALFRINISYEVDDLSDDDHAHYRIKCRATSATGIPLGEGLGEASSKEDKWCWRAAVCQEEFDETLPDRRRVKWKKGRSEAYKVAQVRTEPADIANTVLKMAEKRSLVGCVRTVTGCSDIFDQDTEDMPNGMIDQPQAAPPARPKAKKPDASADNPNVISDPQCKRLYAKCKGAGLEDDFVKKHLKDTYGYDSSKEVTRDIYDEICAWADNYANGT